MASDFLRRIPSGRDIARRFQEFFLSGPTAGSPEGGTIPGDGHDGARPGLLNRLRRRLIEGPASEASGASQPVATAPPAHRAGPMVSEARAVRHVAAPSPADRAECQASGMAAAEGPAAPDGAPPERLRTERLLGVLVADATAGAVAARMVAWSPRPPARTVVGLDLTVADALRHDPLLRRAFREADAVVPASLGVLLLARREGAPLAGRVAASDLVTAVAAASARAGRSLFLVGSIMEDLHHLARRLSANHAGLEIRGAYAVPRGFERDPAAHGELLGIIRTVRPHVILVALEPSAGAVWAEGMAGAVPRGVFVTLGAGVVPDWDRAQRTGTIGSAAFGKDIGGMLRNGLRNLPHALAMTPRVPALWREHRKDRESYHALERRRALARLSDERYCQWRASLREDAEPSSGSDGDHGTS